MNSACRVCGTPVSQSFCDLGMSPLANSYLSAEEIARGEVFQPLHTYVCTSCFLVQLPEIQSPAALFTNYLYFSSYSSSWLRHAEQFAIEASSRFDIDKTKRVIEIASNDGYLLQHFVRRGVRCLGIEPADNVAEAARGRGIPTRTEFFTRSLAVSLAAEGETADLLIGNNVLAHVPDVNDFVAGLAICLAPTGVLSMEFPHLLQLIRHNQFDTIYHEHFSYFSLRTVVSLFAKHGLRIFDVEQLDTHGGSLRIYACHTNSQLHTVSPRVDELLRIEEASGLGTPEGYLDFATRALEVKRDLVSFLVDARTKGFTVAAYGAPAKGNTLLNYCSVGPDLIAYTVDRNPHKQGMFLPGSHLPILHPDQIVVTQPDYILVLPWNLRSEIMTEMAGVREWGGRFVIPIPELEIIE